MAPSLIFGAGGIGATAHSFTFAWSTPEKVSSLLITLQDLGITELDSAAGYPPGNPWNTETLLGETQAASRGFTIDSKVLTRVNLASLDEAHMTASVTRTLELLHVGKVRTMYAHTFDSLVTLKDQAANFHRLYLDGKFERLGLCNYTHDQLEQYFNICEEHGYIKPAVYQGCYNALYRGSEKKLIPLLRKHDCAFYAFSPLAGGFLTGKVTFAADNPGQLERTRWRGKSAIDAYTDTFDKVQMHDAIRKLQSACQASRPRLSLQEAALRWIMHHSALRDGDGLILGATKMDQLESNVADIRKGPLDGHVLETIESLWALVDDGQDRSFI